MSPAVDSVTWGNGASGADALLAERASAGEAGSMFSSLMIRTVRATSCSLVASWPRA